MKRTFRILFAVSVCTAAISFLGTAYIFVESFSDPRWRVFGYTSRQATENDIYTVADIPAITAVTLAGKRTLRLFFTPSIDVLSWTVRARSDNRVIHRGLHPDIPFPDTAYTGTFLLEPEGFRPAREIAVTISFFPAEAYAEAGLTWPDNYYSPYASVPFNLKKTRTLDEWAGLPGDDPEVIEARRIMGDIADPGVPVLERSERVFRFIMDRIKDAGGIPTDAFQLATPFETYEGMSSGAETGWCENRALVYYLFANAAGVKTRLVDLAGKFGPLKLTGHYVCESWSPEYCRWFFVDPQSGTARMTTAKGLLLTTLDIKRLVDLDSLDGCTVLAYDRQTGQLEPRSAESFLTSVGDYFRGEIVIAYKSGYPRNRSYSRLEGFLRYPTLLWAPFELPKLYRVKQGLLLGLALGLSAAAVSGTVLVVIAVKRHGI